VKQGKIVIPKSNPGAKGFPHVEATYPPYCAGTPASNPVVPPPRGHDSDR
jgi:hypothetical protein